MATHPWPTDIGHICELSFSDRLCCRQNPVSRFCEGILSLTGPFLAGTISGLTRRRTPDSVACIFSSVPKRSIPTFLSSFLLSHLPLEVVSSSYTPLLPKSAKSEVLMGKDSTTDKFFDAVMRPGPFSTLTLRTAVDHIPISLTVRIAAASAARLFRGIQCCSGRVYRDDALHDDKYWNALKHDWEGFIDVEKSNATHALVLGAQGQGDSIVVEHERVGALVVADLPFTFIKFFLLIFQLPTRSTICWGFYGLSDTK